MPCLYIHSDTVQSSPSSVPSSPEIKKKKLSLTPKSKRHRSYSVASAGSMTMSDGPSPSSSDVTRLPRKQELPVDFTLEEVAASKTLSSGFMSFCEKKFASENYRFYLECREYKKMEDFVERREQAVGMVDEFLKNGAEYEVRTL